MFLINQSPETKLCGLNFSIVQFLYPDHFVILIRLWPKLFSTITSDTSSAVSFHRWSLLVVRWEARTMRYWGEKRLDFDCEFRRGSEAHLLHGIGL